MSITASPATQRRMHAICQSLGHSWTQAMDPPVEGYTEADIAFCNDYADQENGTGFCMTHVSGTGKIHLIADEDGMLIRIHRPGVVLTALRVAQRAFGYGSPHDARYQIADAPETSPYGKIAQALGLLDEQLSAIENGVIVLGALIKPDGTVVLESWHQQDRALNAPFDEGPMFRHWTALRNLLRAAGADLPNEAPLLGQETPSDVLGALVNYDRYIELSNAARENGQPEPLAAGESVSDWLAWEPIAQPATVETGPRRRGGFRAVAERRGAAAAPVGHDRGQRPCSLTAVGTCLA